MTGSERLPLRVRQEGPIRFFFDEDTLGIAEIMARARGDCIFPGHPRSPIGTRTRDVDWIQEVSAQGWIAVARDKKIRSRPAEKAALAEHPLRILVLTTAGNLTVWEQLRVLVMQWDRIEERSAEPAPWMYAVTKNGLRPIAYPE